MKMGELLIPIVTVVTAQMTVLDLARFRFNTKKMILILGIELIIQMAISAPFLIFSGIKLYGEFYFFTMDLPAFLTFWYVSKRRDFRDLFTVLFTIFISFSVSLPSMWVAKLMGGDYLYYNLSRILIFVILFPMLHFAVRKHYLMVQDEIEKGWVVFSILPIIGSAILYTKYWQYTMDGNFYDILVDCIIAIIIMATVFIVFFYVFAQLHEKYIVQEQKRILAIQNKAQREQYEQQKEDAEKTNRRWHDMRHNLQELIELLEAGNIESALTYLKEQRGVNEIHIEQYCLHPTVNSILCLWAERSRKAGIKVEIKADVPAELDIEPVELSALFANAIENAYEGCLRIKNVTNNYIKVVTNYNGRRLAIGVTNTCMGEIPFEGGIPISSKSGGGIGTRSIDYTVKRFRGTAYYEAKDGVFTARFILNV